MARSNVTEVTEVTQDQVMAAAQAAADEVEAPEPIVYEDYDPNPRPEPGVATMENLFTKPLIVDEVQEVPLPDDGVVWWLIRPGEAIEDMTVGDPSVHISLQAGRRYRVPEDVARILFNRDKLMEVPVRA